MALSDYEKELGKRAKLASPTVTGQGNPDELRELPSLVKKGLKAADRGISAGVAGLIRRAVGQNKPPSTVSPSPVGGPDAQRTANMNEKAGGAGGTAGADASGTGVGTVGAFDVAAAARPAQQLIKNTQAQREFDNQPMKRSQGAFRTDGTALGQTGAGTFNTVSGVTSTDTGPALQAAKLAAVRRGESLEPTRRAYAPDATQQIREEAKARQAFYDDILSKAGRGPGGEISLRAALGVIAQMEGQRLQSEAKLRGQDITFDTATADREQQAEIAFNRQRIEEVLGQLGLQSEAADRASREGLASEELAQRAAQFEKTYGLEQGDQELQRTRLAAETAAAGQKAVTDLAETRRKAEKDRIDALAKLSGFATGKDIEGMPVASPEVFKLLEQFLYPSDKKKLGDEK